MHAQPSQRSASKLKMTSVDVASAPKGCTYAVRKSQRIGAGAGVGARTRANVIARAGDASTTSSSEYDVPYDVVNQQTKKSDGYELRVYGAYYVAATPYENRERGLTTLLEYLEGGNEEGAMYPPTQPLTTRYNDEGKTMELALLGRRARESIAAPRKDSEVRVIASGGELLAAVEFEGNATPEIAEYYRSNLTSALEKNGLKCASPSAFRINTFGPLYSLKTRRNELLIEVNLG